MFLESAFYQSRHKHSGHRTLHTFTSMLRRHPFLFTFLALIALLFCFFVFRPPTTKNKKINKEEIVPNRVLLDGYGYNGSISELRMREFPQLNNGIYLDYMGAGQYQKSQLEYFQNDLTQHLYGNSHSLSDCSRRTEKVVDSARDNLLEFFGTDSSVYTVVFTSGATGALKLIGETFPFVTNSLFAFLRGNHNSVVGIREYALERGGDFVTLDPEQMIPQTFTAGSFCTNKEDSNSGSKGERLNLFAFPAEDNFDGTKHPLATWTTLIHSISKTGCRWKVLLDAAAFAPTNELNLGELWRTNPLSTPDFVALSIYKMVGFPTGLGALLVRNDNLQFLRKTYFGGGQVRIALPEIHFMQPSWNLHEQLEAGTVSFQAISALPKGLQVIKGLGGPKLIQKHTWALTKWLYNELSTMRHISNPKQLVCEIYGKHYEEDPNEQGSVLTFNILLPDGKYIGFGKVAEDASNAKFQIRTGCMCNPGSCYSSLGISTQEVLKFAHDYKNAECFDDVRIRNKPVGAVRVSIGYPTTFEEVHSFAEFIRSTYSK